MTDSERVLVLPLLCGVALQGVQEDAGLTKLFFSAMVTVLLVADIQPVLRMNL